MPLDEDTPAATGRRDAMRTRLVAAARARMAAQGVAATTMQQIVADAHTSIGNCYFYFRDKDALFGAVAAGIAGEIAAEIAAATGTVPEGAAHLAVTTIVGVRATLARAEEMQRCIADAYAPGIRELFLENFTRPLPAFLAARFPAANVPLAVAAWQGAVLAAEEAAFAGPEPPDVPALGRWLAAWNLQALGLPEAEVREALAAAERFVGEGGENDPAR